MTDFKALTVAAAMLVVSMVGAFMLASAPEQVSLFVTPAATIQRAVHASASADVLSAPTAQAAQASAQTSSPAVFGTAFALGMLGMAGAMLAANAVSAPRYAMFATEGEASAEAAEEAAPAPPAPKAPAFDIKDLPGVLEPTGYWDPLGMAPDNENKDRIMYMREAEIKHGRVCMLGSLGFVIQEQFHPLFGGTVDAPSAFAFQQTPLGGFWPFVLLFMAWLEKPSVDNFADPNTKPWTLKEDFVSGDLGFDPFNIKPKDPKAFKVMQTKELQNGRLAMIGLFGMIAQEIATGKFLFA